MRKKGYVSIEALIITAMVTVVGFSIFVSAKDAMGLAAAKTLGFTYKFTQDMADKLNIPWIVIGNPNGDWDSNSGNTIKNDVGNGQVPAQTITLNVAQSQTMSVGGTLAATATISPSGIVSWTIVSGADNVVITCSGGPNCLSVTISAIKAGTAIVRASVLNNSAFKDIVINIQ